MCILRPKRNAAGAIIRRLPVDSTKSTLTKPASVKKPEPHCNEKLQQELQQKLEPHNNKLQQKIEPRRSEKCNNKLQQKLEPHRREKHNEKPEPCINKKQQQKLLLSLEPRHHNKHLWKSKISRAFRTSAESSSVSSSADTLVADSTAVNRTPAVKFAHVPADEFFIANRMHSGKWKVSFKESHAGNCTGKRTEEARVKHWRDGTEITTGTRKWRLLRDDDPVDGRTLYPWERIY